MYSALDPRVLWHTVSNELCTDRIGRIVAVDPIDPAQFRGAVSHAVRESKIAMLIGAVLVVVTIAVFARDRPQNPYDLLSSIGSIRASHPRKSVDGMTYWLGTDGQGRDMLSAIFYGLRVSLMVGVLSGAIALTIGSILGVLAAYLGGRFEQLVMRIVDIQLGFPAILVALILLAVLGKGVDKIIIALVTVQWAYYARTARSAALVERNKEYIEAARSLGLSGARIVLRHLLPNALPPLIVVGTVQVAHAIALERRCRSSVFGCATNRRSFADCQRLRSADLGKY